MKAHEIEAALAKHFDQSSSKVIQMKPKEIEDALGFGLTEKQLIGLVGAPSGSEIEMEYIQAYQEPAGKNDPPHKVENIPEGLLVKIINPNYLSKYNQICLHNLGYGKRGIYIKLITFSSNPGQKGLGALMLRSMLNTIYNLPQQYQLFSKMQMLAAGGRNWGDMDEGGRWSGYAVWPKYGFDMRLLQKTLQMTQYFPKYPQKISDCKKVSDVLALPGGDKFWHMVGDGWNMEFEISLNSTHIETLDNYLTNI